MPDRLQVQDSESDGLLVCRRCTVRYAWAADFLAMKAERDRYREALRRAVRLIPVERPEQGGDPEWLRADKAFIREALDG